MSSSYSKYFPVLEYYHKFISPMNPKRYWIKQNKLMVCPIHNDHDPSLGVIRGKDGSETVHCFGCNYVAKNIIIFHQDVVRIKQKRLISEEESLHELCEIFGVDYSSLPNELIAYSDVDKDLKREVELSEKLGKFDISDYRQLILEGKRKGKGIGYFNTLMMTMLNEVKEEEYS